MNLKDTLKLHHDPREVDQYFGELSKLLNIAKNSYYRTRDIIIDSNEIENNDKKKLLTMLDSAYQKQKKALPTSDYDNKPYTQLFFDDFLEFINNNNLKMNEFKVVLAIYKILHTTNTYGNILLNFNLQRLSEVAQVPYKNLNRTIKDLIEKDIIIKDKHNSLYLNCQYFFRGTKKDYDMYQDLYTELKNQPQQITTNQTNDNLELPLNDEIILLNHPDLDGEEEWTTTI